MNAAAALGDPDSFGTIEVGKRADLLLLDRNPLETVKNLRNPRGVMVRGIWLDEAALRAIRLEIRTLFARAAAYASLDAPSPRQIDGLVAGMESLGAGWTFNDHQLDLLAAARSVRRRERLTRRGSWRSHTSFGCFRRPNG